MRCFPAKATVFSGMAVWLLCAAPLLRADQPTVSTSPRPPNIVFILADDLG
jgi:hypothetical protein